MNDQAIGFGPSALLLSGWLAPRIGLESEGTKRVGTETDLTKPGVGDSAPDVELPDDTDRLVRLSALWQERPLALLFVRHFG